MINVRVSQLSRWATLLCAFSYVEVPNLRFSSSNQLHSRPHDWQRCGDWARQAHRLALGSHMHWTHQVVVGRVVRLWALLVRTTVGEPSSSIMEDSRSAHHDCSCMAKSSVHSLNNWASDHRIWFYGLEI